ncbi:MAG TPA: PQQ-binding-like beta-propeller repeat protein, partial [Streptosporangiaceae bacterium]
MGFTRGSGVWARRGTLAAVLVVAALAPGRVAGMVASRCTQPSCHRAAVAVRWSRPLPGNWTADGGALGTVLRRGEAYTAAGGGVAAVGFGVTVAAFGLGTGQPLWTAVLAGYPAGAQIVSMRAWPGVITAGVSVPDSGGTVTHRDEVVLSDATGVRLRSYPAAVYGGAVQASKSRTVIVGSTAVTAYANRTGKVIWRRGTGKVPQNWRVSGGTLYVAESAGGYLGAAPVTAVRRISLRTGAQRVLRPPGHAFAGTLAGAASGAMLFTGQAGLAAYSDTDGRLLWHRAGALLEAVDSAQQTLYVTSGSALTGIDPATGKVVTQAATGGAVGLYAVAGGVALGLDEGALGDAWGYDLATKRVTWTTRAVPWPHFFVDLSGIGGSVDSADGMIVLASCAQLGTAASGA